GKPILQFGLVGGSECASRHFSLKAFRGSLRRRRPRLCTLFSSDSLPILLLLIELLRLRLQTLLIDTEMASQISGIRKLLNQLLYFLRVLRIEIAVLDCFLSSRHHALRQLFIGDAFIRSSLQFPQ